MNKEQRAALRKVAEPVKGWSNCNRAWFDTSEDDPSVVVGHIDEEGNYYPVATIDCDQYYQGQDSLPLAKFYAAANPSTILQLLDYIETLEKDAGRWKYARQFLAVEDIESWNGPDWKGHQPNESENIRADETIDAAMQGETE